MKKIVTLTLIVSLLATSAQSQVVLNELYGAPSAGNHEFFELFNVSTSATPSSVDGVTVVTYFEDAGTKGFYILDLPSLFIQPRGYLVGASSIPFNYQSHANASSAAFSWNDPNLVSNSGYLQKWVMAGNDDSDGNKDYNLAAVPSNLNDFLYNKSGSGFNSAVFVYSNGVLVNSFYGGTGIATQPELITSMPRLNISFITGGVINPFSIKFNDLNASAAEYMISSLGSDNGYIRSKDGVCNTWVKSSASVNHTPSATNGTSAGASGTITIASSITRGINAATTSIVTYDITAGPSSEFPVELQLYIDNGSVTGELDALDTYLGSTIQNNVNNSASTMSFSPREANIIIVGKTAAGCFGMVQYVNTGLNQVLPVKLLSFGGVVSGGVARLTWKVDNNETIEKFELQSGFDGINFDKTATIDITKASGVESYGMDHTVRKSQEYYRLKMFDGKGHTYSKIIMLANAKQQTGNVRLLQNPVSGEMNVAYLSGKEQVLSMRIVDLTGRERLRKLVRVYPGSNQLSYSLDNSLTKGIYVALFDSPDHHAAIRIMKVH